MKIGILTLPFNNNYGGYLQAYALMTVLKNIGHDVELIYRKHNKRPLSLRVKYFLKTFIKCCIGRKHGRLLLDQDKELREKGVNIMPFVDTYISPKTKQLFSTKTLGKLCNNRYDAIIVGSDQVWRPDYVPNIQNFFLNFIHNDKIIKISYAASFGERKPKYTEQERIECGQLIQLFDHVSLREDSGLCVIKDFGWKTKISPKIVLDPTMLLDKAHYERLLTQNGSNGDYVCTYLLDDNSITNDLTETIVKTLNIPKVSILDEKNWKKSTYKMPSIEYWLQRIHDAKFVVTDSFHGTVFCILFNVPFIVYNNQGRGSDRFLTLLGHFGLEDRLVSDVSNIDKLMKSDILWEDTNLKIQNKKKESLSYLYSSIIG